MRHLQLDIKQTTFWCSDALTIEIRNEAGMQQCYSKNKTTRTRRLWYEINCNAAFGMNYVFSMWRCTSDQLLPMICYSTDYSETLKVYYVCDIFVLFLFLLHWIIFQLKCLYIYLLFICMYIIGYVAFLFYLVCKWMCCTYAPNIFHYFVDALWNSNPCLFLLTNSAKGIGIA